MSGRFRESADEWAGRPVLVTGAGGFVGRWLVEALAAHNAVVWAHFRDQSKAETGTANSGSHNIHPIHGSLTDLPWLSKLMTDAKIEVIFHLAASNVNKGASVSPYDLYESNTRGVYTVLEAARSAPRAVRVVVASSKEAEDCFATETPRKFHPYMTSKAAAELITRAYADTYGVAAAVLRLGNVYGGGDFNTARLIPSAIQSILRGETPVIRGDGSIVRDFLYVEDAVAAFLALGSRLADPGTKGKIFPIATGTHTSLLEVVQEIMRAAGLKDTTPQVLGEKCDSRVDIPHVPPLEREHLGWHPRFTLAEGLQRTWAWHRDQAAKS